LSLIATLEGFGLGQTEEDDMPRMNDPLAAITDLNAFKDYLNEVMVPAMAGAAGAALTTVVIDKFTVAAEAGYKGPPANPEGTERWFFDTRLKRGLLYTLVGIVGGAVAWTQSKDAAKGLVGSMAGQGGEELARYLLDTMAKREVPFVAGDVGYAGVGQLPEDEELLGLNGTAVEELNGLGLQVEEESGVGWMS
jgi:hypothetical protein